MIWWIAQPSRARSEGYAIDALQEQHEWLRNVEWTFGKGGSLSANFEIERLGRLIPLTISYPRFFPDMPPQVFPREEIRLSSHQWGAGGELCLEYRPDNWDPAFTGAMMIESAHRLLQGEEPAHGVAARVESAHATTVGQDIRGVRMRFLLTNDFADAVSSLEICRPVELELSEKAIASHWVAVPRRLGPEDAALWSAGPDVALFRRRNGFAVRMGAGVKATIRTEYDLVKVIAETIGHEGLLEVVRGSEEDAVVLVECDGDFHLMWLPSGGGPREMIGYTTVKAPSSANRLPGGYDRLASASVGIVGCGSVGSKVAASLARAGLGRFVVVDGDVLFPGNLVRNDLDWRSVGLNKPDAVAKRIREIRPSAHVTVRRLVLGGQESSLSTDSALDRGAYPHHWRSYDSRTPETTHAHGKAFRHAGAPPRCEDSDLTGVGKGAPRLDGLCPGSTQSVAVAPAHAGIGHRLGDKSPHDRAGYRGVAATILTNIDDESGCIPEACQRRVEGRHNRIVSKAANDDATDVMT